ncbi:cytochrome P450 [Nocardia asiatica]|uniref:cytochrome P450 n=1 Tax=Nocardia asiatica TaxID=209252 RepID=UPI003EE27891
MCRRILRHLVRAGGGAGQLPGDVPAHQRTRGLPAGDARRRHHERADRQPGRGGRLTADREGTRRHPDAGDQRRARDDGEPARSGHLRVAHPRGPACRRGGGPARLVGRGGGVAALRGAGGAPAAALRRRGHDIAGARIPKGEAILASYVAANRDPKVHGPNADEFDVRRSVKDHLAFGYGAHHCLGAPLARLEAEIALPAIFRRFPAMRLAVDPSELGTVLSFISNGHSELPVFLEAAE